MSPAILGHGVVWGPYIFIVIIVADTLDCFTVNLPSPLC